VAPVGLRRRLAPALLALALGSTANVVLAPVAGATTPPGTALPSTAHLPAPFNQWNVQLRPSTTEQGALTLTYRSPRLGIQAVNSVYLPSNYRAQGAPSPVMYYLHGTVISYLDNPDLVPVTKNESLLNMVGKGGGYIQTLLQDFPSQLKRAKFIVVAPDTDPQHSWCETCMWINGKANPLAAPPLTASVVPAEDVLLQEVLPLTQALFNTRTDRGGRGIMGFSMGSVGAEIQGFRHPDLFSYIGGISGPFDMVDDPFWSGWLNSNGYFRDQGYGTSYTNTEEWRQFNPKDLAHNWKGVPGHLLISAGDTCAAPTDPQGIADCRRYPPDANPAAAFGESQMRRSADESIPFLESLGVIAQQFRASGIHGANNHRVYADIIIPTANKLFAQDPSTLTYRAP
jgi:S-formylglutathione hydrolase FrmB